LPAPDPAGRHSRHYPTPRGPVGKIERDERTRQRCPAAAVITKSASKALRSGEIGSNP